MNRESIPSSWTCLGKRIGIRLVEGVTVNGHQAYGLFDPAKPEILVDRNIKDETLFWETLAHEVAHAIHWRVGLWQEESFGNQREVMAELTGNALGPLLEALVANLSKAPQAKPKPKTRKRKAKNERP